MVVLNNKTITSTSIDKINYGQSFNILSRANASKYTQLISHEDLIKLKLFPDVKDLFGNNVNEFEKFLVMLSNVYQSVTTKGLTTPEIVAYIIDAFDSMKLDDDLETNDEKKKNLLNEIEDYIAIFHVDFTQNIAGNNDIHSEVLKSFTYGGKSATDSLYGDANSVIDADDQVKQSLYNIASYLNFSDIGDNQNLNDFGKNINSKIDNPDKSNPNVSVILMNNRNMRTGVKNALELSSFFNLIPTLEYTKAYPFFNATFILPSISKQDTNSVFKTATLNQFLFGGSSKSTSTNFQNFEARVVKDDKNIGVKTNLSVFTTPQTFVNMDEKVGHRDILDEEQRRLRITSIHDPTQPFMTLKDFTIDVSPTKGLMSFKTGKISLVLHDRTRMVDIAPFIKPDLFGAFGAEIVVEYGWSHNESQNNQGKNPIGEFLNSSRCIEKYMIVNSQFSIENNGQVNINLSIAMKGPIDIRQTEIFSDAIKQIEQNDLSVAIANYQAAVSEATGRSSGTQDFTNVNSLFSSLFSSKEIKRKNLKKIDKVTRNLNTAIKIYRLLSEVTYKRDKNTINGTLTYKYTSTNAINKIDVFNRMFGFTGSLGLQKSGNDFIIVMKSKASTFVSTLVKDIYETLIDIRNVISKYKRKNKEIQQKKRNYIKSLTAGTQFHDMFFDRRLLNVLNYEGKSGDNSLEDFQVEKITKDNYISLGTIITSFVSTHMARSKKYDEIQLIFNTVNDKAGLASNYMEFNGYAYMHRPLNIASLMIKRDQLEKFLTKLFDERTSLTLESLISQIVTNFVITRDNPCYGLSNLFVREDFDFPVKPRSKSKVLKEGFKTSTAADRLNYIYYLDNKELYDSDPSFLPPGIHMTFDSLTTLEDMSKTICRITIYDRNDNPYQSICDVYNERFLSRSGDFKKLKQIEHELKSKLLKNKNKIKELETTAQKLIKNLLDPKTGLFKRLENGRYEFNSGFGFDDLKEKYKKIVPAATFATQNTSLINASVATVNEGKLNTVYITRADRNNKYELNNKVLLDSPLRILPAQASIEMFGCPWINFGQYIFLDFETGTTLDNTYAVTGVKHTITPGKFSTQVSLSYGDAYGRYEGMADGFSRSLQKFVESDDKSESSKKSVVASIQLQKSKKIRLSNIKQTETFSVRNLFFNNIEFDFLNVLSFFLKYRTFVDEKEVTSLYLSKRKYKKEVLSIDSILTEENLELNEKIKKLESFLRDIYNEKNKILDVIFSKTSRQEKVGYKLRRTSRKAYSYKYLKLECVVMNGATSTIDLKVEIKKTSLKLKKRDTSLRQVLQERFGLTLEDIIDTKDDFDNLSSPPQTSDMNLKVIINDNSDVGIYLIKK